jgi:hypothetical protein
MVALTYLRLPSLTDQIYIKAQRIRSLQENEIRKIDEDESMSLLVLSLLWH